MLMTRVKELWHQRKNNLKMFAFTTDSISAISLSLQTPRCFINVSFNKKKSSSRVKTRQWNDLKREQNDSKTLSYKARRTKGSIKIKRFKKRGEIALTYRLLLFRLNYTILKTSLIEQWFYDHHRRLHHRSVTSSEWSRLGRKKISKYIPFKWIQIVFNRNC